MALGDNYASLDELKTFLTLDATTQFDETLSGALDSASREIERYSNRQFHRTEVASARVYATTHAYTARIDDFYSTSGLIIATDVDGDGVFEVTWSASDYELLPLNGIVNGQTGWPYRKFNAVGSNWLPYQCNDYIRNRYGARRSARLQVTALWGWTSVPAPVHQACLMLAAKNFQIKDAPFGVAGMGEFGFVRVQDDRGALGKLKPFRRDPVLIG